MWKRRRRSYDDWPNSWFRTAISRQALISQLVTNISVAFQSWIWSGTFDEGTVVKNVIGKDVDRCSAGKRFCFTNKEKRRKQESGEWPTIAHSLITYTWSLKNHGTWTDPGSHRIGVKGWLFWQELCGEYVQNKRFQASRRISQIPLPRPVLHKPSCHLVIKYLTLHAVHSGTPHFCWPCRLLALELRQQ